MKGCVGLGDHHPPRVRSVCVCTGKGAFDFGTAAPKGCVCFDNHHEGVFDVRVRPDKGGFGSRRVWLLTAGEGVGLAVDSR
ncbi:hypothetical protein Tco_1358909, partial [Tanacetum coccineum]